MTCRNPIIKHRHLLEFNERKESHFFKMGKLCIFSDLRLVWMLIIDFFFSKYSVIFCMKYRMACEKMIFFLGHSRIKGCQLSEIMIIIVSRAYQRVQWR